MTRYSTDNFHGYQLRAREEFWNLTPIAISEIAQGCGPGKGFLEKVVPDIVLGICLTPACVIHDVGYFFGETEEDKSEEDQNLLYNCLVINNKDSKSKIMRWLRRNIILGYFCFVDDLGRSSFWSQEKLGGQIVKKAEWFISKMTS